jgi:uncharacterized protein DUF5916
LLVSGRVTETAGATLAGSRMLFMLLCLAQAAGGQTTIDSSPATLRGSLSHKPEETVVSLEIAGLISWKADALTTPPRALLDLTRRKFSLYRRRRIAVEDPIVRQIGLEEQAKDIHVVFDLRLAASYEIERSDPNHLVVRFKTAGQQPTKPDPESPAISELNLPGAVMNAAMSERMQRQLAGATTPAAPVASAPVAPYVPNVPAAPPANVRPYTGPAEHPVASPIVAATPLPGVISPLIAQPNSALHPEGPIDPNANKSATPLVSIPHVRQPPKLADYFHGSASEALKISEFRQREPHDSVPVTKQTIAYLSYDDENLYVIFVCRDDPGKVRARLAKREDIGEDDQVGIYLDTFHDRQHAYLFASNPLGVQLDGIVTEGQSVPDLNYDTVWSSEGRLTEDGYVVRMAIPFRSLRFPNRDVQMWGIALQRTIYRENENSFWPAITRRHPGFVPQMGSLRGLEGISAGRNIQIIPYTTFTHARFLDYALGNLQGAQDWRGGVDAKAVLHDSLTFDLTFRPDFSQVESDDPQVLINQRFEVLFPEKRPFFTENASYFDTPLNLFYSRRIIDPQRGARLTGKLGRWALGILAIDDDSSAQGGPNSTPSPGYRANIGVARIQREFGSESRIGVLATTREDGAGSDRLISLDTRLKLAPNWFLNGQIARDFRKSADGEKSQGEAYWAQLLRTGRHFTYVGSYLDLSPTFQPALGFVPRVDLRQTQQYMGYLWRPEGSPLLSAGPSASLLVNQDTHGHLQDWLANTDFFLEFPRQTTIRISRFEAYSLYRNLGLHYERNGAAFSTAWFKWFFLMGSYGQGTAINYNPAATLQPFVGNSTDASLMLTLRPKPRFRFDEIYLFSRLTTARASVFDNHLVREKANYQLTRALSVRAILDYNAVLPNTLLVNQTQFKQVTGDVLLTYLIHPGTAFYVGYTNRHEDLLYDPTNPLGLQRFGPPAMLTAAQWFVKLSYLFRF